MRKIFILIGLLCASTLLPALANDIDVNLKIAAAGYTSSGGGYNNTKGGYKNSSNANSAQYDTKYDIAGEAQVLQQWLDANPSQAQQIQQAIQNSPDPAKALKEWLEAHPEQALEIRKLLLN